MSEPSAGALRAADAVTRGYPADDDDIDDIARIIDRETGLPELLEALEDAVKELQQARIDPLWSGLGPTMATIQRARTAIAKAKGEEDV